MSALSRFTELVTSMIVMKEVKSAHNAKLGCTRVEADEDEDEIGDLHIFLLGECWRDIMDAISQARRLIYITGWKLGRYTYTHHQKTVIVDADAGSNKRKIISFVGGLDLCDGRYDTSKHQLFKTLQMLHKDDFHNPTFAGDDIPPEHHALVPSFMGGGGGKRIHPLPFSDSTPTVNCHMYVVQTRSMDPSKDLSAYGYGSVAWKERVETWRQKQERLIKNEDDDKDWGNDSDGPDLPVRMTVLKSKKAVFVSQQADTSCSIWFVCKVLLVQTRTASHTVRVVALTCPEAVRTPQVLSDSILAVRKEGTDKGPTLPLVHVSIEDILYPFSTNELVSPISIYAKTEGSVCDNICHRLQQSMAEAENLKREAYEESFKRRKAEKDYIEATNNAKQSEKLYASEVKIRKKMEEALARETHELNSMTSKLEEVRGQLSTIEGQKGELEIQISDSKDMVKELEVKLVSFMELMKTLKEERERLELERDKAVTQATKEEKGSVYRGFLRSIEVTIKMLQSNSLEGCLKFQLEVNLIDVLLPPYLNGSLEDRLVYKDDTPPLSWQTRIRISIEVCSTLIFLHSNNPKSIIHGDLKPANILLDANLTSKLSAFGTSRLSSKKDSKGTSTYMDPEFLKIRELTPSSEVYSFRIILLRLLTGRLALDIEIEVETALEKGKLGDIFDVYAGDWPFMRAKQLAHLALRCCSVNSKNRPDLGSKIWKVLEPIKVSCGTSISLRLRSEENCQGPSYFVCPIFQETMQDPHIAADGFTHEVEAIKGWIDGGHKSSPMTNLELAHCITLFQIFLSPLRFKNGSNNPNSSFCLYYIHHCSYNFRFIF
ncbi:hypothetical protein GIB67_015131 [Kingdonia uniflora]|uniref:RING-type E3 ubiquitin transferase n=1 Tax=Kingdonia uniflora TaxID=39325 RepID=A0A7J7LJ07_9MAGN|nr:hypothetical protein GIB67_015131 [Kingdonia uniflora]